MKYPFKFLLVFIFILLYTLSSSSVQKYLVYSEPKDIDLKVVVLDNKGNKVKEFTEATLFYLYTNIDHSIEIYFEDNKIGEFKLKSTFDEPRLILIPFYPLFFAYLGFFKITPDKTVLTYKLPNEKEIKIFLIMKDFGRITRKLKSIKLGVKKDETVDINRTAISSIDITEIYHQNINYYIFDLTDEVFLYNPNSFNDSVKFETFYTRNNYKDGGFTKGQITNLKIKSNFDLPNDNIFQLTSSVRKSSFHDQECRKGYSSYYCFAPDSLESTTQIHKVTYLKKLKLKRNKHTHNLFIGGSFSYLFNVTEIPDFSLKKDFMTISLNLFSDLHKKRNNFQFFFNSGFGFYNDDISFRTYMNDYCSADYDSNNIFFTNLYGVLTSRFFRATNESYFASSINHANFKYSPDGFETNYQRLTIDEFRLSLGTKTSYDLFWFIFCIKYYTTDFIEEENYLRRNKYWISKYDEYNINNLSFKLGLGFNLFSKNAAFFIFGEGKEQIGYLRAGFRFKFKLFLLTLEHYVLDSYYYDSFITHTAYSDWFYFTRESIDVDWYDLKGFRLKISEFNTKKFKLKLLVGYYENWSISSYDSLDFYESNNLYDNDIFRSFHFSVEIVR